MHTRPHLLAILVLASSLAAQASWTRAYPTTAPSRRTGHVMAYDEARQQVLLFGGQDANTSARRNDLWAFTGTQWQQVTTSIAPPVRSDAAMVGDTVRQRVVLFGGRDGATDLGDTWELVGGQWLRAAPLHAPAARSYAAMAFDSARGRTVLFGGNSNSSFLADTWEYDGADWTQRTAPQSPTPRAYTQLVYDPIHRESVLYGGHLINTPSGLLGSDTWSWDGTVWTLRQPAHVPGPSERHRLTFDEARGRLLGHGFADYVTQQFSWEWDGDDWHILLQASPGPYQLEPMAYDRLRRQVVLYGYQFQPNNNFGDTWIYATDAPAGYTEFGSGCAGSAGTPLLRNAPYSWPWLGDNFIAEVQNLPAGAAVVLVTGPDALAPIPLAILGLPGCDWLVTPEVRSLLLADPAGVATWSLAIPNLPVLAGASLGQQAFVLDAGAPGGAVVSNGAELVAGVR